MLVVESLKNRSELYHGSQPRRTAESRLSKRKNDSPKKEKMATYKNIQNYIKEKYNSSVKTCWIADIKDQFGIIGRKAFNRKGLQRLRPCPPNKKPYIIEALRYFKMIN